MPAKLISPLALIFLWEIASRTQWVDPRILPPPSVVFLDLVEIVKSGELLNALIASLRRVFAGFLIAVATGIMIGTAMARSRFAESTFDPLVELIRPVSPLALFPLALLWFGIGDASKIFLIALASSFPVILNTYAGVKGIDRSLILASRSFGANRWELFTRVILPGSTPQIFTGVRLAWGISLIVIIATEMVGSVNGLGYMILNAQQVFLVPRVFSGIVVVGVLGFLTDLAFRSIRGWMIPWYRELQD